MFWSTSGHACAEWFRVHLIVLCVVDPSFIIKSQDFTKRSASFRHAEAVMIRIGEGLVEERKFASQNDFPGEDPRELTDLLSVLGEDYQPSQ